MGKCKRRCDRFCTRCKWCRVFDCRRPSRLVLWLAFLILLVLMIVDLILGITIIFYFYIMTNAILLFRLFGLNWITYILHLAAFLTVVILIGIAYSEFELKLFILFLLPIVLLFLFSLHYVMIRPGRSVVQRARRAGAHGTCGLVVVIYYFFLTAFLMDWYVVPLCLEMIYLLIFLFIMLTPHFQTSNQAVRAARERRSCARTNSTKRTPKPARAGSRSLSAGSRGSRGRSGSRGSRGSRDSNGSRCSHSHT